MLNIKRALAAISVAMTLSIPGSAIAATRDVQKEEANRKLVLDFYDRVFNKHDIENGVKVMAERYKQHNPNVPNGKQPFASFFSDLFKKNPDLRARVVHVAADGDLVWLHVHITTNAQDRGQAVVDIFCVENGQIIEHWDVLQPVPEKSVNGNPMF